MNTLDTYQLPAATTTIRAVFYEVNRLWFPQTVWFENGSLKVGVDLYRGGILSYIYSKLDLGYNYLLPGAGAGFQSAVYFNSDNSNPTQGGDESWPQVPAPLIDYNYIYDSNWNVIGFYTKSQGLNWKKNGVDSTLSDVIFEVWTSLDPDKDYYNGIKMQIIASHVGADDHGAGTWTAPVGFFNRNWVYQGVTYTGTNPYTYDQASSYPLSQGMSIHFRPTENWAAIANWMPSGTTLWAQTNGNWLFADASGLGWALQTEHNFFWFGAGASYNNTTWILMGDVNSARNYIYSKFPR